jgi:phosphatidylglycerol:prolipoprotein diacylglycerol transferase
MFAIPYPIIDPIAFEIGPLAVRWYGLSYFVSILLGWWYVRRLVSEERIWPGGKAPLTLADVDDLLLWMTIGIIVGGRLGNALFYNLGYYAENPLALLRVWEGGWPSTAA